MGICTGLGNVESVSLSSRCSGGPLDDALRWANVKQAVHHLVHENGLARLTSLLEGLEV